MYEAHFDRELCEKFWLACATQALVLGVGTHHNTRLYEGSKKSGSKIAVEESSSDRRLRLKILRLIEESSNVVFVFCSIVHTDGK